MPKSKKQHLTHLLTEYGMILVLILLGIFFSLVTLTEQRPSGKKAGLQIASIVKKRFDKDAHILIASRNLAIDKNFYDALSGSLTNAGFKHLHSVQGTPRDARANITNQIAVIAIIAIGMTVVIICGGIDLSVGSLIAFSAVLCCLFIQDTAGGLDANAGGMILACIAAIIITGLVGSFTGSMITAFSIPPFIVTLGVMMMASGTAYLMSGGESVYRVPDSFVWLGREASLFGIPNAVFLMMLLYSIAHIMMSRTQLGRYIYAVGGNAEAARLAGVPVKWIQLFAYTLSGLLAGLGGVVMASQLKSGAPTYGQMYELYVIAAVVVGGTSLSGGEGKIFGTLIGAFIIAVIQNGMNLMNIESYTQKVILGMVILIAVLLDKLKQKKFQTS